MPQVPECLSHETRLNYLLDVKCFVCIFLLGVRSAPLWDSEKHTFVGKWTQPDPDLPLFSLYCFFEAIYYFTLIMQGLLVLF